MQHGTDRCALGRAAASIGVAPAPTVGRAGLLVCLVLAAGAGPGGCEQRVVQTQFGHETARQTGPEASSETDFLGFGELGGESSGESGRTWAIALAQFTGPKHQQQAKRAKQRLANAAKFADVWVAHKDGQSTVYHGKFDSSGSVQAQKDLRRWRWLQQRGRVRAEGLMLVPIIDQAEGSNPKHDLRRVRRRVRNPEQAEYTLQIGFYDQRYGEKFRRAAEKAVAKLREEGYRAFYYHGPNRSMVTVGVFGPNAVKVGRDGIPQFNEQIQQLQEEFPHNFGNGRMLTEKRGSEQTRKQPSFPVRIPRSEGETRMSGSGGMRSGGANRGGFGRQGDRR